MIESTEKDNSLNSENVEYAKFWTRAGAYLIDAVIIIIITLPTSKYNIQNYKSFSFYLVITIIAILYKPLMESFFGATLGKLLLDLKVTNLNYNRIGLKQSFVRSSILIVPTMLYIPIYFFAFNNPDMKNIISLIDFSEALASYYPIQNIISNLMMIILLIDIVVLLIDKTKRQVSLHDQIGKTYVIKTKK
jgi:uncharacterized RDD family membrane protein YckC